MQDTEIRQHTLKTFFGRIAVFLYTIGYFTYNFTVNLLKKLYRITGLRSLFKFLGPVLPKDNLPQLFSHAVKIMYHRTLSLLTGVSASVFEDRLSPKAKRKYAAFAVKRFLVFIVPVAVMCMATFWVIHLQDYIAAYKISIDGRTVATVENPDDFYNISNYVSDYVESLTGTEYNPSYAVSLRTTFAYGPGLVDSEDKIRDYLLARASNAISRNYGLYVDGQLVLTDPSYDTINGLLENLKAAYLEGTATRGTDNENRSVAFIQDVKIQPTYVAADAEPTDSETTFIENIVAPIASATKDINIENKLLSYFDSSKIYSAIEARGNTKASVMPLSVKVVQYEERNSYQNYSTERVADSSMTKGSTKTVQQGVRGVTVIKDEVYLIDGEEVSRATVSKTVVSQPVKQIVHYGTKVSVVTGKFIRPVSGGSITSYYGYRKSGFHTGVDIARPTGTKIVAADGGTVIFAGRSGSYGLLIKIDHGNGYVTYYAHCSAISVTRGQQVSKGDTIGKVGSTGNSTGPHLHFEVRYNGNTQNPLRYISG